MTSVVLAGAAPVPLAPVATGVTGALAGTGAGAFASPGDDPVAGGTPKVGPDGGGAGGAGGAASPDTAGFEGGPI
jgi:hypothetical protein